MLLTNVTSITSIKNQNSVIKKGSEGGFWVDN